MILKIINILKWCVERYICLLGFHGYNCVEDVDRKRCSYCGCYFEGWLPPTEKIVEDFYYLRSLWKKYGKYN